MALFNFGKKDKDKKEWKKSTAKKSVPEKTAKVEVKAVKTRKAKVVEKEGIAITPEIKAETKPQIKSKRETKVAPFVLKEAHITEKAGSLQESNQYVFKVFAVANKIEIKKAVAEVYGVDVIKVTIVNIPKKQRRLGRSSGWKKGYKKAIVRIKKGQVIELIPR